MTDSCTANGPAKSPSDTPSRAPHTVPLRPRKCSRVVLLVIVWAGVSLTRVSLAASSPSHKSHEVTSAAPRHAPSQQTKVHPSAPSAGAHPTQRRAPLNARLAAKSKASKRTQQRASKPSKVAAKKPKPVA